MPGLALLFATCAPAEAPSLVDVVNLDAPVGVGSGMPHLEADGDRVLMSWLEPLPETEESHALRVSWLEDDHWSEPRTLAIGTDFFVNWADFPSALALADGSLVAHWLERGGRAQYDYDVRVVGEGPDGVGESWSPHEDGTPTEHGFVSMVADRTGESFGIVWLDGRKYEYAKAAGGTVPEEMTVRFRSASSTGPAGPEIVLDGRTCDCCQTDAAMTDTGLVVVYRDRSEEEIRDIAIVRALGDGSWSEPRQVHEDGWEIAGCPVNGPAIAATGSEVAVTWFTAAQNDPRVLVAFSDDAGSSFGTPTRIDGGDPLGRVDIELTESGAALVSWIEEGPGSGEAEVRVRRVSPDGSLGRPSTVSRTTSARASGFPQMVRLGERLIVAWTDAGDGRVRVARASVGP